MAIEGILLTMVDFRTNYAKDIAARVYETLPKRYAVAIKWRYGNTWVDLALVFSSLYISKRWKGKIQRGKEKFLLYNFSSDILKA